MASTSAAPPSQEFVVRVPKDVKKVYGIMKFNPNNKVDFTTCETPKIHRENNMRDFKAAHNMDTMPKFGAGSEFGRDQKEEARRKKYGIYMKSYNVDDQPWQLKMGSGKTARSFKGTKEGGISDNASYYIFTQCADGAFEAFPVDEWYNFNPQIKYKHLSAEEAEEQFSKREQIMNYHTIMVQKRIRDDKSVKDGPEDEDDKKMKKKKNKSKDFMLTEMDEWAILSDDSDEGSGEDAIVPKKQKKTKLNKKSGGKTNSDDEAVEESDEADEGREVDYMTDTDSDDDDMFADKDREAKEKYQEKGVEDEEALQKLIESDEEEEEEKPKNEEDQNEEGNAEGKDKKESGSDSSSSSDSDSDPDQDNNFSSAVFMQVRKPNENKKESSEKKEKKKDKGKKKKKDLKRKGSFSSESSAANSRSATPTVASTSAAKKDRSESPMAKKPRVETPIISGAEGLTEDTVRRYLMRKPMTTKDLLQKFKSLGLPKDKLFHTVAEILKKLNPEKNTIKDKLYLSIKQ